MLFGVEPTGTLLGVMGSLFSVEGVDLLGVNIDVTTLNADLIMSGCTWGSSNNSFTVAMLEPSGWLTSTWCSIMGLVGIVIRVHWCLSRYYF